MTETALADDISAIVTNLQTLRGMGVRVALDDFGSGYSSVGLLARLPIDILKIDREFTQGMADPSGASLVSLMIGVGRTLGLEVIAEGVEDERLADTLTAMGCDHQQGGSTGAP